MNPLKSMSLLAVLEDVTMPFVVRVVDGVTADGVAAVLFARYSAATPATCGVAIEVPLMVLVAVLLVYQAEVIDEPGAKMSRQVPKLE